MTNFCCPNSGREPNPDHADERRQLAFLHVENLDRKVPKLGRKGDIFTGAGQHSAKFDLMCTENTAGHQKP